MNFFLLLKNELSLHFLRNHENILNTLKTAIRIYASEDEKERKQNEELELQLLEKIIKSKNLEEFDDGSKNNKGEKKDNNTLLYDKIVTKLLEYN